MIQRMKHDEHGYHIAYSQHEVDALISSGWKVDEAWGSHVQPQVKSEEPKKRGRPKKD